MKREGTSEEWAGRIASVEVSTERRAGLVVVDPSTGVCQTVARDTGGSVSLRVDLSDVHGSVEMWDQVGDPAPGTVDAAIEDCRASLQRALGGADPAVHFGYKKGAL